MGSTVLPPSSQCLPGRDAAMPTPTTHFVLGTSMIEPFPEGAQYALFGMGCFWGVERKFWVLPGVFSTHVGYAAGHTRNPTYKEVCTGMTAHNEVCRIVFDPTRTSYDAMLKVFWENHDPTQGMRQGGDVGTQYRSGIYPYDAQQKQSALASRDSYALELQKANKGSITTEIVDAPMFFYAEEYHQQYLAKNPEGYCGIGGTGVACPVTWR